MGWLRKVVVRESVVTRTVLGNPEPVTMYRAYKIEWMPALYTSIPCTKVFGYYHTCAQAFAEHPDAGVDTVKLWKVGDTYVKDLKVAEVKVQPKPKRAKGKA